MLYILAGGSTLLQNTRFHCGVIVGNVEVLCELSPKLFLDQDEIWVGEV